jgi:hypothetical protein
MRIPPLSWRQIAPLLLALTLLLLFPKVKRLRLRIGMAAGMIFLFFMAGCSGSGVKPITGNITIQGTSAGTAGSVSHSVQVAITVD